jgi:dienelactone hydrolase
LKPQLIKNEWHYDGRALAGCAAGRTQACQEALMANNKTYKSDTYEGKQHGFYNDTTPRYDEGAAKLAWERTLEWFNKYLR